MKKITLKQFFESKEKLVVNLKTEEQANKFCKKAHKLGYKWCHGVNYSKVNMWIFYKEETCYTNDGYFNDVDYYKNKGIKILNFEDIKWEEN